jgi:hypothetical protein
MGIKMLENMEIMRTAVGFSVKGGTGKTHKGTKPNRGCTGFDSQADFILMNTKNQLTKSTEIA